MTTFQFIYLIIFFVIILIFMVWILSIKLISPPFSFALEIFFLKFRDIGIYTGILLLILKIVRSIGHLYL